MLNQIVKNRGLWLLVLVAAWVVVMTRVMLSSEQSFGFVAGFGYWFMLVLTLAWGRAVIRAGAWEWVRQNFQRFDVWVLVLVMGCTSIWWAHEKPGFKILADEVLLLGTSMGMHFDRSATYPSRATDVQGPLMVRDRVLDKRPLLFPFLVATGHDLTGYRPDNAFYFNRGLGIVFLLLMYVLGWQITGRRWAGVVSVLLFAGLPLAAQQSAGSGFELLNLAAMGAMALALMAYLRRPDGARLELLVFTGLILSNCRYESILFLLPMVVVIMLGWWRSQRIELTWPVLGSTLFLAPWLSQNRIFSVDVGAWQMASKEGVSSPFSFDYVGDNLGHALAFFFDFSGYQASSALFAALGILALPFFGLWLIKVLREISTAKADDLATSLMGIGLFGIGGMLMLYFWGQFDDRIISRLSLPVHLLFMVAVVVVARTLIKSDLGWKALAGLVTFAVLAQSLPVMAKRAYEIDYAPGLEMELRREFLDAQLDRDFLFIDNDSVFWITHLLPASSVNASRAKHEALSYHLRNHSFSAIYVFQSVLVDDQTGDKNVDPVDDLGAGFTLETIWERKVETLLFARISRIVAIEFEGEVVEERDAVPLIEGQLQNVEDVDQKRAEYLENWIKQLP